MSDNHVELRANAMLSELKGLMSGLIDRCAILAAENAELRTRLKDAQSDNVIPIDEAKK